MTTTPQDVRQTECTTFHHGARSRSDGWFFSAFTSCINRVTGEHTPRASGAIVRGDIVELGAGTGADLHHIPAGSHVLAAEPSPAAPEPPVTGRPVGDHDVDVDGLRLHVREVGCRSDPPVVVLHGIMSHRRDWDVLVHDLAADHRIIAPDLRGHGLSAWSDVYSVAAMVDDVAAVMAQLDVAQATVIGHSLGGMVATALAAARPHLVRQLVVVDIAPDSLSSDFAAGLADVLDVMAGSSYESVDDATNAWLADAPLARQELLRNFIAHALRAGNDGRLHWRFDAAGLREFASTGITEEQLWRAFEEVRCPSLLIRGEHSPLVTAAAAERTAHRCGAWDLVTIPGGGHDLGVEKPEEVTATIRAFLAEPER